MEGPEVAELLLEIGRRAALEGGNPYKAKAYMRAAESLRHLTRPLGEVIRGDQLREIPGVGASIARRIVALDENGTDPWLEKSREKYPAGLLDLLGIPRLKPATIVKLHQILGIASLDDLEQAAREDRLKSIKGLGEALQRKILEGLAIARAGHGQLRMNRAQDVLENSIADLRRHRPDLYDFTIAGDLRRACEVVSDLSLVACSSTTKPFRERLGAVSLHVAPPHQIATALLYATGNQQHLAQLESLAQSKGLMLSASGLAKGRGQLTTADETAIYKALGLPFIPPELREGQDEIELASSRRLPKLVEAADLNGLLHIHTDFSDGVHTLEEMAEAARALGYQYLGISDHSQSAHYAGGLSVEAIEDQHLKIDRLNRGFGKTFRILKGIESDISVDGSLDYPDEILARFDFVVASVHSQFKMERAKQTARIIAAVSNPFTTILGHPTGRLLLRRPGYQVDIELILKACAEHQVAAEINCNPNRLDLDWRWHRRALKLGCSMSVNPDAHSIRELELVKWGVAMARKGGVPKSRVLNSLSQSELLSYLERRAKQSVPKQTVRKRDRRLQRA